MFSPGCVWEFIRKRCLPSVECANTVLLVFAHWGFISGNTKQTMTFNEFIQAGDISKKKKTMLSQLHLFPQSASCFKEIQMRTFVRNSTDGSEQDLYTILTFVWKSREKVEGKKKESVNICGRCRGCLRWAAICRLISAPYIIELGSFFFWLHAISITSKKMWPRG